ncbi:MAG: IPT/TIG domain-containing protein, partial [Candidatus Microthrix sp.]|nr:IPT/TIG domain-containing protein [Candidatus Microthrix sp.]
DTGGTLVDIIGADLTGATAVDFGGTAGTGLTVDPSGSLATVTSPAHTAGPAPVTITTPAGTSNAETFTFEAPPVVTVPVIYGAYPVYLCADAPDSQQVLIPVIYPITDVVSAEVGGVDAGVVGVLDIGEVGFVFMFPPSPAARHLRSDPHEQRRVVRPVPGRIR